MALRFLTVLANLLLAKVKFQDFDEIVDIYESMPMMWQVAELLLVTLAWPILVVVNVIYVIYMIKKRLEPNNKDSFLFARIFYTLFYEGVIFMYYNVIPEWVYQLDTTEKLITFLKFFGRDDLVSKLKTEGYLYLNELLNADKPKWIKDWNPDMVKLEDVIDFINFYSKD